MSGLLQLQAMSNEHPEITQALNISVDRINAMANGPRNCCMSRKNFRISG